MSGKKKKRENGGKNVTTLTSQLKPEKKKARKKTHKRNPNINGTRAVSALTVLFILASFSLFDWLMEAMIHLQVNQTENGDCEALTVLLADLAAVDNSRERASKLFQWLISPVPAKTFFRFLQTGTPSKHF